MSLGFWIYFPDKPEVLALLDQDKNPFPKKAPHFIRSKLFKYHFTGPNEKSDWWTRDEAEAIEYSPPVSKDDPPAIKEYLEQVGITTPLRKNQHPTNFILVKILTFLRSQTTLIPHHYLVWSVSWIALPILMPILL